MKTLLPATALLAVSASIAHAGVPSVPVSEPGMFGLFAAAVAAAIIGFRVFKK